MESLNTSWSLLDTLTTLPQNTRIITLDGTHFLQPAPIMLQGLTELKPHLAK